MQTSWETSSNWYDKTVGEKGHYYHQTVILPGALKLLALKEGDRLLDIGCGQGVFARHLPQGVSYLGLDASPSLISQARKMSNHAFQTQDATEPWPVKTPLFTHATIILALQNIDAPQKVVLNIAPHLSPQGKLLLVLNHPCFRIPRQSSWQIEEEKKLQYRRIDRYLSPLKIPIKTHPSGRDEQETWSFHHPLSSYTLWLKEAGFTTLLIEEWISDKKSSGAKARMENRCREEFPLFLALLAEKR